MPASAQIASLPGVNEVLARPRLGYDAKGLAVGGLRLYPKLAVSGTYDDNIYSSDVLTIGDRLITIEPQASLRTDWSRHSLAIDADARIQRFDKTRTENNEQYRLDGTGRLDVTRAIAIDATGRFDRIVVPRGSTGDVVVGGTPLRYDERGGTLGVSVNSGRLVLGATGGYAKTRYTDIRLGGLPISQAFRNFGQLTASGQAGLRISPTITLYGTGAYNRARYDNRSAGFNYDAHGYSLLAGVGFEVTRLISARASIGYQRQRYADPRFSTLGGLTYQGSLLWNPTTLVSVRLDTGRAIQQSPLIGISGVLTDHGAITVDYELLRNLLINVQASADIDDYRGTTRRDRRVQGTIAARYLINRYVEAGASYGHRRQRTDAALGREYDANAVTLSLRLQL